MAITYALQKCPACSREFAVQAIMADGHPHIPKLARCLYCAHEGENFLTATQQEAAQRAVTNMAAAIKAKLAGKQAPIPSMVGFTAESTAHLTSRAEFPCCASSALHDGSTQTLQCPFWGHADSK